MKQSAHPLPLLIADLEEKIIDQFLTQQNITEIKPMLSFPGYITHTDLPAVYNGAKTFLYTSLRESFGIPLLEAMASGIPVITSATSAIPEIAGEGAILIQPTHPQEIADALLRLETDEAYRQQQITYGIERAKLFSWKQTAAQLLKVYQQLNP